MLSPGGRCPRAKMGHVTAGQAFEPPYPSSGVQDLKRRPLGNPNFLIRRTRQQHSNMAIKWAKMQMQNALGNSPNDGVPVHQPATSNATPVLCVNLSFKSQNNPVKRDRYPSVIEKARGSEKLNALSACYRRWYRGGVHH